ncbi:hypothetical protein Bcav_0966 [Beutenbergia cavernae DSM 12333]|uniref:Uncharacterized protein n=1 Tax=Beutenbergia cavernae (strain ATCC BAA-8 / DSM 12333 / CCUG 43141 / JCM 11478 / NBRC 16432 / NCIMB 13614 / HKI 0122) TaxID=471853 RepID=C5C041_BEUC1|nr:hypothetical protein [Beutenbergia cavernae]ACQ79227.1 hypothetical protein Bcav_0966 [Beutenbergia cavernae DSM 12333]
MQARSGADADDDRRRVQDLCARFTVPAAHLAGPDWLVLNLLEDSFLGPDVVDGVEQQETLGVRRCYEAMLVPGVIAVETMFAVAAHRIGVVFLLRQHLADALTRRAGETLLNAVSGTVVDHAWELAEGAELDVGDSPQRRAVARVDGCAAFVSTREGALAIVAGPDDLTDVVEVAWAPAAPILGAP